MVDNQVSPVPMGDTKTKRNSRGNPESSLPEKLYHALLERTKDKDWILRADGKYQYSTRIQFAPPAGWRASSVAKEVYDLFGSRPVKGISCDEYYVESMHTGMTMVHILTVHLTWEDKNNAQ